MKVPMPHESQIAFEHFPKSSQLGKRTAPSLASAECLPSCAACSSSSLSAKRPMSTGMNSIPSVKEIDAERIALHPGGDVLADGGEHDAERAGDQVLDRAVAASERDHGKAEHGEREIFRRPERVREARKERRGDDQHDDAEDPPIALASADMPSARPASPFTAMG